VTTKPNWHPYITTLDLQAKNWGAPTPCAECGRTEHDPIHHYAEELARLDNINLYFFGCWREAGHFLHDKNGRSQHDVLETNPWGYTLDGSLCPNYIAPYRRSGPEIEGQAKLHHKDGWTALFIMWWSRWRR
jgi:hypothetical protein